MLALLSTPYTARRATAADLAVVAALQASESNALGFLPYAALLERLQKGLVSVVAADNETIGYAVRTIGSEHGFRITQICVRDGCRRLLAASTLLRTLITEQTHKTRHDVDARCAATLRDLGFWFALGFHQRRVLNPANARKRQILELTIPTKTLDTTTAHLLHLHQHRRVAGHTNATGVLR